MRATHYADKPLGADAELVEAAESLADGTQLPEKFARLNEGARWFAHQSDIATVATHMTRIYPEDAATQAALLRSMVGDPWRLRTLCGVTEGITKPADRYTPHCPNCAAILTPAVLALATAAYRDRIEEECGACEGTTLVVVPNLTGPWTGKTRGGWPVTECTRCNGTGRTSTGRLDPTTLAVLADPLEEAGCVDPDILMPLRGLQRCSTCGGRGRYCSGECHGSGWFAVPTPRYRGFEPLDVILGKE